MYKSSFGLVTKMSAKTQGLVKNGIADLIDPSAVGSTK